MTDIHDIKPPERPVPRPVWLFYLLAVALTLALLALILLAFRRRRRDRSTPAFPPLSPSQQALKALEEIRDVERVEGRVFYFRLSAILREYLKGRFGINAPEMTVEELLPRIRELNLPTDLQGNLSAFFRNAEPVKFAGRAAVQRQMEADLAFSVAFVRETDPGKDDLSENETARKGAAA